MPKRKVQESESDHVFVKVARASAPGGFGERWCGCETCPTLNVFDNTGDTRAVVLIKEAGREACLRTAKTLSRA